MLRSLCALTACGLLAVPALAADEKVRIVNVETGKVLAVVDDSDEAGARAALAKTDPANKAQQWEIKKDGKSFSLVNVKSGKALDVFEASKDEGVQIIVWDAKDEDADNQRWTWEEKDAERRITSKLSELVLDVDDEGRIIQKKADAKAKKQLWKIEPVK
ncbi:Ricin-type beta-trefoil lectin domain protein [Gemmata obscuriglobus]|uniref:Ricin B lectin domain-containing protein n=1 Tax=Gemmata obscuriglobus TaxID=114 RepID=A0A2Z3H3W3_9BACT|nr:RICIN domain-containing protein [Gemmata obscuriglobus]AWM35660.1 hypothetical protein C1280_00570 [Gemmata obscuriglobus]QEG31812.1 Ricin-type beta-trefoil lectin domain protein [Gemmata obscuriglobus]VTS11157.1 Putative integron gene cassette protein OS=uncultured bacterium GN=ORF1 PE=4 SV=1: RicinB_lectin_2 [Gemmata obscuriglobus UQM 2246]